MHSHHPACSRPAFRRFCLFVTLAVSCLGLSLHAQEDRKRSFNLPADVAEKTLKLFSEQSGRGLIMNADTVSNVKTNAVQGEFTPGEALKQMLANTALIATEDTKSGSYVVKREGPSPKGQRAAMKTDRPQSKDESVEGKKDSPGVLTLSPFVVSGAGDNGYASQNTVVGSRSAKALLDLPANISIINSEMMADLDASDVHGLLQYGAPGVNQNQTINDDVNIRGFRSAQSLRDGVTVQSYKSSELYDVDRVEVIKGPGAMLLGNNDFLGGGVNFVTRKPTATNTGDIQVTYAADGHAGYTRLQANTSGPLTKGKDFSALYRVTIGGAEGSRDKDIEEVDQRFIGGALQFFMGPNTSVSVNLHYYRDDGYKYWNDFLDITSTKYAKLNQYSTSSFSPGRAQDAFWNLGEQFANLEFLTKLTENGSLRIFGLYSGTKDDRRHIRGIAVGSDNYTLERQEIPLRIDHFNYVEQVDYLHRLQRTRFNNDFSAGFDYSYTSHHQGLAVINPGSIDTRNPDFSGDAVSVLPNPPFISNKITKSNGFSFYLQDNLSFLNDHLILVGGLRWFDSNSTVHDYIADSDSYSRNPRLRTHKYGIVYKPLNDVSVYYTNAQNVFPQIGFTDYGVPLKNQFGKLNEFGAKVDHKFNDQFSVFGTVAYFDMALTNDIIFDSVGNTIQSGQDTSKGWEVSSGLRAGFAQGHADLLATYYNAKTFSEAQNGPAYDAVPWSYSLLAKFTWLQGPLQGLMVGGGVYSQGAKLESDLLVAFPTTYNLFARYNFAKHWGAQLNWDNVTNKRYVVAAAASGLVQASDPGTIRLQLKYGW